MYVSFTSLRAVARDAKRPVNFLFGEYVLQHTPAQR